MSDEKLSLPETAFLLILMREAGEVSNTELQERYGVTLTGKERLHLNALKLVDTRKQGRAYAHILTDAGWGHLGKELKHGIPAPGSRVPYVVYAALSGVLGGLHEFMESTDSRLANIFGAMESQTPVSSADPDVEKRIRAAYAELAARPGTYVSITRLRPLLSDLPRAVIDDALRAMNRLSDVNIVPESNQKMLTAEDREAAVTIGDQEKHVLWIGA
ncbi:hypothetical protein AB0O34_20910 [Sphaerisporangium sp. NPDC088356]|uniref:hypothetical protein n=1 Tax=Sphaerisporangium sp. NPDC088356 TaxID=3154871 RepID=UPI00343CA90F